MKLDRRQKILIPIIIIAFIYIGWQLYNIFFAGPGGAPSPAPAPKPLVLTKATPVQQQPQLQPQQQPQAQMQTGVTTAAMPVPRPQAPEVPQRQPISVLAGQTVQSDAYLKLMKQYQALEAQRMLLQEKVAIAEMKQKIADLNAKLSQLPGVTTKAVKTAKDLPYKLIYLDHQQGEWTATLADANNVFKEVSSGSRLNGGYRVIMVNSKGVVIKHASGKLMQLTFDGLIPLRAAAPPKPKYQVKIVPKKTAIKPKYQIKAVPKTKPVVKKQAVKHAPKVVKPIPIMVLPKTTKPNYTLKPSKPMLQKEVVELKALPKQPKITVAKPAVNKAKMQKQKITFSPAPKPATVVELKLPTQQHKITKPKPAVKKPVDLNYNPPPPKIVYTKARLNNKNVVINQLQPQKPQTQTQNNSGPIIMMN